MSKFKLQLASVPDREHLVVEIWYNEILIAEINQETAQLEIQFYVNEKVAYELDEFLEILQMAKRKMDRE